MEPITYFDVAGQVVAKHPVEVLKLEMRANDSLAAGCFWQVHDFAPEFGIAVPADGAVPLKSWPASAGAPDYKEFKNGELCLQNGLYICMSTTEATKTLGAGTDKFASLAVELLEADRFSAASDEEDGSVSELEVWAESAGPKRLVRVKVTNLSFAAAWLMLFAHDSPQAGDVPLKAWELDIFGEPGGELDLRFGDGLRFQDNDGSAGGIRRGCTLAISSTATELTPVASGMDIYAEHMP